MPGLRVAILVLGPHDVREAASEHLTGQFSVTEPSEVPVRKVLAPCDVDAASAGGRSRSPLERQEDKVVEGRAVHVACVLLERDGWRRVADRQRDGAGYDFEYRKGNRSLHVEVKGSRGNKLRFNMTGKEWRRAAEDPDFVVVAATRALDDAPIPHLLMRDRLATAQSRLVEVRILLLDERAGAVLIATIR